MRIRIAVPDEHVSADVIDPVLEAVTRVDQHLIESGQSPTATELVRKGAIWRPENPGDEHFDHGSTIASRGWGDCDDWAPLRAAELRATGEDPDAFARVVPSGPNTFHAIVNSKGRDLLGPEDVSVQAGMKGHMATVGVHGVHGAEEEMRVWACDPHDGRIYQGQLAPTVGPLSIHCGPGLAVRGCTIVGPYGPARLFEARVDMPVQGSRLVHVRAYARHRGRRAVHGAVPCAMSITHLAPTPQEAINGALVGAILASPSNNVDVDRYKLMALQGAMSGMAAGDVRERLIAAIHEDLAEASAASGQHPTVHLRNLQGQAGVRVSGVDVTPVFHDTFQMYNQYADGGTPGSIWQEDIPPDSAWKEHQPALQEIHGHRRRRAYSHRRHVHGAAVGDTLGTNSALLPGQSITNKAGTAALVLQTDGNLVLKNLKTGANYWTSGTAGKPVHNAWMNADGNLRVNDAANNVFWSNGVTGHANAFARIQDDGQLFVWDGSNHQLWDAGASLARGNATPGGSGHSHTDFGGLDTTLHDVANVATSIVADVSKVVNAVPWGEILHDVQAVVSVVPGLGTVVSEVLAAAESAIDFLTQGPLLAGLHAAYNFALAAVPGASALHTILDPIANTLFGIATSKQPPQSQVLDTILANVPDSPAFGPITPKSVVSTLAHFIISHLGVTKTPGYVPKSTPSKAAPPHPALVAPPKPKPAVPIAVPKKVVPIQAKPPGVAHAAMPVSPQIPPHPTAAPAPSIVVPRNPAAPPRTTWHCAPLPGGHWACAWQ